MDNIENIIEITEVNDSVSAQEIVEFVTVVEEDIYDIELDQAFPSVGEVNEQNRHSNLMGRDEPGQHIISSISGLREELDGIEALQTFYSDKRGRADYYLWKDENKLKENRVGYFVSLSSEKVVDNGVYASPNSGIGRVEICDGEKIFGVVVSDAGFIGWQDNIERNHKYGLIASDGIVAVKCETNVAVGDYVLSNYYGMAKKSPNGYGYKVVAIENIDGIDHAIINLNASMENVSDLADDLTQLENRVDKAETNIVSAINVATEAYNLALSGGGGSGGGIPDGFVQNVNYALQRSEEAMNVANSLSSQISDANSVAVQAKQIANNAVSSANAIKEEALSKANEALTTVNTEVVAIQEVVDTYQENIDKSILEFDGKIDGAISNIGSLDDKVDGLSINISETTNKLDENSATIQNLAALINSNYVGFRSRASGLSTAQLDKVLDVGTVYVPIETHTEEYACSTKSIDAEFYIYSVMGYSPAYGYSITEIINNNMIDADTIYIPTRSHIEAYVNNDGTEIRQSFIKGYVYEWNGVGWTESKTECVGFSNDSIYKYKYDEENNKLYVDNEDTAFLHDGYIYQDFEVGYYYIWTGLDWEQSSEKCVSFDENIPNQEEYDYWYVGSNEIDGYSTETLYYYKNDKWVAVATLGENITHRVVSLIQQFTDENAAAIDLLVDYDKEKSEAIANISLKADENSASIQNLTSYANKYTVGDVSPANGFTVEEANDYFVSDVYYAPTVGHREEYGEVESIFDVGYLYTWNDSGWTKSEIQCVYHGGDIPTDKKYTHWYTGVDNVAEGYEKETLYMKNNSMWIAIATLDGGIAKATASIMQKVSDNYAAIESLASLQTETSDALALYKTEVSDTYATQESVTSLKTEASDALTLYKTEVSKTYATQESIASFANDLNDNMADIKQQADENGASIQALAASLDQYSVGKHSQANELDYNVAKDIVKVGSIFVPTESNFKESYKNGEDTVETEFVKGAYYEWKEDEDSNPYWYEYTNSVFHTDSTPVATETFIYWFNTNTVEENGYIPEALYKWENNEWKLVALLSDNSLSRAISSLRTTQNSIEASINDAKGDFVSIDARITGTESSIQDIVEWKTDTNENLATIKSTADDAGASIAQVVESIGKDGEVNAASIVAAVNSDSSVAINADRIQINGYTSFSGWASDIEDKTDASSIRVEIQSNRGNIFKSRDVSAILTCRVWKAGVEITNTLPNSAFKWIKINDDGTPDTNWNTLNNYDGKSIVISNADVLSRAMFNCEVQIEV